MTDDIILNKSAIIERCLKRIQEEYSKDKNALRHNYNQQDAIILNLQRACEAVIDMGMHVVRLRKLGPPQSTRDIFSLLEQNNIISLDLKQSLQSMIGFRNIAVHEYQTLNLEIVMQIIEKHLKDLSKFSQLLLLLK